jgi:hypothetical protein
MEQMMMCTPCISNYYFIWFYLEIVYNEKKLEKNDGSNDDVYILHVKRYVIRTYNELEMWCGNWWCVYFTYQVKYI